MIQLSVYCRRLFFNFVFGTAAVSKPAGLYVGLLRADGTEPSGGAYARKRTFFSVVDEVGIVYARNNGAVDFGTATDAWGEIAALGVYDAATGGNLLAQGSLALQYDVIAGDSFSIEHAQLAITAKSL